MSSGNFQSGQGSSSTGFESCVSRWHSWFATYPSEIEHIHMDPGGVGHCDQELSETQSDCVFKLEESYPTFPCTDDQTLTMGSYLTSEQRQWNILVNRIKHNIKIVKEKSHGSIYHLFKHDFQIEDSHAQEYEGIHRYNSIEMTHHKESHNGRGNTPKLIPCVFSLPCNGKTAFLCGNFPKPSFNKKIPMVRSVDKFIAVLHLPRGIYYYRFYVDGKWSFLPEHPNVMTRKGQKLNVFDISNYRCKYYQIAKEYQKARKEVFHQKLPELSQCNSQAPSLPFLLEKTNQMGCFPGNNNYSTLHSLSNRIYIDESVSRDIGENVVCTCVTCVWRSPHMLPLSTTGPIYTTVVWITNKRQEGFLKESFRLPENFSSLGSGILKGYSVFKKGLTVPIIDYSKRITNILVLFMSDSQGDFQNVKDINVKNVIEHTLSICWEEENHAEIAMKTLSVDLEESSIPFKTCIQVHGCCLKITIVSETWRSLRTKTNSVYDSLILIADVIQKLKP